MSMRRVALVVFLLVVCVLLSVGPARGEALWLGVGANGAAEVREAASADPPAIVVTSRAGFDVDVTCETPGILIRHQKLAGGEFAAIEWPSESRHGEVGTPSVPVLRRLMMGIPGVEPTLSFEAGTTVTFDAKLAGRTLRLAPVQAPIPKTPGALEAAPFAFDAAAYAVNADVPAERVTLEKLGVVCGRPMYLLEVRPVAFNAAKSVLTVWPHIDLSVTFGAAPPAELAPMSPGVAALCLNGDGAGAQPRAGGDYLIVAAQAYSADLKLAEFDAAKEQQGFNVLWHTVPPGTTAATIKAHIAALWSDPLTRPEYVLLVGDTDTIPAWTGGGEGLPPTDLPYVCMDGTADWHPEMAIGRLSVRSAAQLAAVVDKTLSFEAGQYSDAGYTARAVFMASSDNHAITEGTHNYVISTHMEPNNIVSDKLYCVTYGATTQDVRNSFNDGRLFGIYSGHGSETYWADGPVFYPSDVNGLTNAGMFPWVCSFACLTGDFTQNECFMETWQRAENRGAVAAWGSSVNSYWTEDDVLEKRLFDVLYDDYVRELGPLYNVTKMAYLAEMGSGPTTRRYFEMYNLLGDPSLALPDAQAAMRVTPSGDFVAGGPEGGPFAPSSASWQIRNVADYPVDFVVVEDPAADWLTLTGATGGQLMPGEIVSVTAEINANAEALGIGQHLATIVFTNLTDHIGDSSRQVALEVGRYAYHSSDVPRPIGDNQTIVSTLDVPDNVCIADLNVEIDIQHSYIGDLRVTLTSARGTPVTLHDRSGGSTNDLILTYDDEGQAPDGPGALADVIGESAMGRWTLSVSDMAGGDTGTLRAWALKLLPTSEPCPPIAQDAEAATEVNVPVAIELQGAAGPGATPAFVIQTLPAHGALFDPNAAEIEAAPYELAGFGRTVEYRPGAWYQGEDAFTFTVDDGTSSSEPAGVSISIGGVQLVHAFLNDDANPGWAVSGAWAFGHPTGGGSYNRDPNSGFTGQNVYGYNLAGDYSNGMSTTQYLTSTPIDCSNLSRVELRFMRWLGVESASYDHASIQASVDGIQWTTVWQHTGSAISDVAWSGQSFDLSAIADGQASLRLRWGMGPTDGSVTYPGWNIDDVEIWGLTSHPCAGALPGDVNLDGSIDGIDVQAFVDVVMDIGGSQLERRCAADANLDGTADTEDVASFVVLLLGA